MPNQPTQPEVTPPGHDEQASLDREVPAWVHKHRRRLPPWLRLLLGGSMILLGILGIVLPIMPGWIFLIPGVFLIGRDTALTSWMVTRILRLRRRLRLWEEARAKSRSRRD
jgi:hypothetical protein